MFILYSLVLFVYFVLCFCFLCIMSLMLPRIQKEKENRPLIIYMIFYGLNTTLLNLVAKFNPLKTILANVLLLVFSHVVGSRLRFIGLTGQISSGKSTVGKYMQSKYSACVIDVDHLNREVLEEKETKQEIRKRFGDEVFDEEGNLNKMKMRKIIFSDIDKRRAIERITHFKVFKKLMYRLFMNKVVYRNKFVVIENALLLRFTLLKLICFPILAICTTKKAEVVARIMQRDGCDRITAEKILDNQISVEEFHNSSDYTIYNDTDLSQLRVEVDKFMSNFK